ncbi:MAG TPA: fatty acid oxidation complex subunit alpha FadJ [Gemmatimonadaceae bacterium]|nr:fatty acid oxidation complex subunit alpha FadJ [Gemmatimonadaceae bacterium]
MTTIAPGAQPLLATDAFSLEAHDGIAVLTLDRKGESVNTLSTAVGQELARAMDLVERDASIGALVIVSGKPEGFLAGADIDELRAVGSAREAEALSREAQRMFARMETLRTPILVAIHGACLGGGVEMALACAYRIATDHPKTMLALPEVMLGLIPGAGGTQRLPRRVGLRNALEMILTGKNVRGRKALAIGLVDELVHPSILRDVAMARARDLAAGTIPRNRPRASHGAMDLLLEDNPLGRALVLRQARQQTLAKTRGHYPAPLAALQAVAAGYERPRDDAFATESRLFGDMAVTATARELIYLFRATTALKKDPGVAPPAPSPRPVHKLGVLGAGFMGAGIASVAAMQGTTVRMKDAEWPRIAKGMKAVHDVLRERLTRRHVTRQQFESELSLVSGTVDYSGFANADLVIEAVFEDLDLKHRVLRETEAIIGAHAIYASNTSTIPIARIAEASTRAEQVLGMHFFSPVHKMPLLEVIVTERTSAEATVTAVAYGKQLGKHVIVVRDGPGFYTTRTLAAYMNEAGYLLDEGISIEALDHAMLAFGFPVGPITLMDEVGLDVGGKVAKTLGEAFGHRLTPSQSMQSVVGSGRLGRKGGKGFYRYEKSGKKGPVDESVYELLPTGMHRTVLSDADIQQRCVLAMVNEAALCLQEGILRSPRDGDVGAVFGIGFPPFRGGPFRYMDSEGISNIVDRLRRLDERFSPRFTPAPVLVDMAKRGDRFHPQSGSL